MNSTLYMALFENIPCYRYERTNRRVGQITRFISIVLIQGVSNQCVLHLTFRKEEIRTQAKENTEYLLDKVEMLKNFTENVSYVFKKKKDMKIRMSVDGKCRPSLGSQLHGH